LNSNYLFDFDFYDLIPEFIAQNPKEDSRGRLFRREFKVDKVGKVFKISPRDRDIITVNQIKDFFDDIGFNIDVLFSQVHGSDISMVYNIGGFLIPFYVLHFSLYCYFLIFYNYFYFYYLRFFAFFYWDLFA
jgi:hypothetical protein